MNQVHRPLATPRTIKDIALGNKAIVLVKFQVNNPDLIPVGTRKQRRRATTGQLDRRHQDEARDESLAERGQIGRHREGRVDTGDPMVTDAEGKNMPLNGVGIGSLIQDLAECGLIMTGLDYYTVEPKESDKYGKTKYVVQVEFSRGNEAVEAGEDTLDELKKLAGSGAWNLFGWDNPDGTVTLNFNGRQVGQSPRYALAAKNGNITAIAA